MAITAEFLMKLVAKAENIQTVFDENILVKEGESPENFQQRKQILIDQTMALIGKNPQIRAANTTKAVDIPIIMDCLGTPLTEGYVDTEGKTYDVSNIDKIPEKLQWKIDGKLIVNRKLNDDLDVMNEQFLKVAIAKQWIMENESIPLEQKSDYLLQHASVNDDDYPGNVLHCPIMFDNFNPTQGISAFIYEDGYSVSCAEQPKSPFTNLPLSKKIGIPNQLLDKLADEYVEVLIEYKQMIQQHPGLQEFVEAKIKEHKAAQAAEIERQKRILKEQKQKKLIIEKYTRFIGIRAQLQLEKNNGMDVQNEHFQKINHMCLFTMERIKTAYPDIEKDISPEAVEQARLYFLENLDRIPLDILHDYYSACNEFIDLTDKIHSGYLNSQQSDETLEKQEQLMIIQKKLEETHLEIKYKLLLEQARGTFTPSAYQLSVLFMYKYNGQLALAPFFPFRNTLARNTPVPSSANSPEETGIIDRAIHSLSQSLFTMFAPAANPPVAPPANNEYDFCCHVSLLGDRGAGKSSLINRFVDNGFGEPFAQMEKINIKQKIISLNQLRIKLFITTDTELHRMRIYNEVFIVAFDVSSRKSFCSAKDWLNYAYIFGGENAIYLLVATKCDIPEEDWAVSKREMKAFAEALPVAKGLYFTSAKEDLYVAQLFTDAANSALQQRRESRVSNSM